MQVLQKHPQWRWVIVVAAAFWLVCSGLVLHRYHNFFPTFVSFDQGIFNQVFWNSLHGQWFESSLSSTESVAVMQGGLPEVFYRRLGQHFTPALLLWLPWYVLFPSAAGLSVLQVTLITAAGLVLYKLARHYHPPNLAMMITVSYYGAIAVISPTLANFHDICQIPLYAFGLFLAVEKTALGVGLAISHFNFGSPRRQRRGAVWDWVLFFGESAVSPNWRKFLCFKFRVYVGVDESDYAAVLK